MRDVRDFHKKFNAVPDILKQVVLLKDCRTSPVRRRRPKKKILARRLFQTKYFASASTREGAIDPVCFDAFLKILNLKKTRANTVVNNFLRSGAAPSEYRGGNRLPEKYQTMKEAIIAFIKTFPCDSSHYCRGEL